MKIKPQDLQDLTAAIFSIGEPYLTDTEHYYNKNGISQGLFRWNMLWQSNFSTNRLYEYLDDEQIDTALRKIFNHKN